MHVLYTADVRHGSGVDSRCAARDCTSRCDLAEKDSHLVTNEWTGNGGSTRSEP